MGSLRFDGTDDRLRWTSVSGPLATAGALTAAFLIRHNSLSGFQGYGYLLNSAGNAAQFGMSKHSNGNLLVDTGNSSTAASSDPSNATTHLLCVRKADGTVNPTFSRFTFGGSWTHETPSDSTGDAGAIGALELGAWLASDPFNGWMGVAAFWARELSQAEIESLDNNWATSDFWNVSGGNPDFLAEMNVAGASVVDLAGNVSSLTATGTTLDAAQTLDSWNFDGTGGGGSHSMTLTSVTETDTAQALTFSKTIFKSLGVVNETDAAVLLDFDKTIFKSLGIVNETDSALLLDFDKTIFKTLGVVTETDSVLVLDFDKTIFKDLIAVIESDEAQVLSFSQAGGPQFFNLVAVEELDSVPILVPHKQVTIAPATEAEEAQLLSLLKQLSIAPASELNEAVTLSITKTIFKSITPVNETDVAVVLTIAGAEGDVVIQVPIKWFLSGTGWY